MTHQTNHLDRACDPAHHKNHQATATRIDASRGHCVGERGYVKRTHRVYNMICCLRRYWFQLILVLGPTLAGCAGNWVTVHTVKTAAEPTQPIAEPSLGAYNAAPIRVTVKALASSPNGATPVTRPTASQTASAAPRRIATPSRPQLAVPASDGTVTTVPVQPKSLAYAVSYPDTKAFEHAFVVPEQELAEMRGRFIESGSIRYFGIQMYSMWQTADLVIMTVGMEWGVDLSADVNEPTVSFFHTAPESTSPSVDIQQLIQDLDVNLGPNQATLERLGALDFQGFGQPNGKESAPLPATAGAGGLETVRGPVQSFQAGGDSNNGVNDMRINIAYNEANGSFAPPVGPVGVPQKLNGTTTVEFETGAKATAFVEHNTIGIVMQIRDLGVVLQEVRGGIGRAAQHVNLTSHSNLIRNTMNINFGLKSESGVTRANINAALQSLKGLVQ